MSENEFLGYVVLAVITLGGFISVITKFTQPINDLKIVIQKLNDIIETMRRDNETQSKHIEKHDEEIGDLKSRVGQIETKVSFYHKE